MVAVNGCCCCFSLRTGTLILLWLSAIGGALSTLGYASVLFQVNTLFGGLETPKFVCATFFVIVFLAIAVASLVTGIIGINGMRKNIPNSLTPYICYMLGSMFGIILFMLAAIFYPDLYPIFFTRSEEYPVTTEAGIFSCLTSIVVGTYFLIVVKSYRDSMVAAQAARNNAISGP